MPMSEKKLNSGSETSRLAETTHLELNHLKNDIKKSPQENRLESKKLKNAVEKSPQSEFNKIWNFIKNNWERLIFARESKADKNHEISFIDEIGDEIVLRCTEYTFSSKKKITIFKWKSKYSLENHDWKFDLSYSGNWNTLKSFLDTFVRQWEYQKDLTASDALSVLKNFADRINGYKKYKSKKVDSAKMYAHKDERNDTKINNQMDVA